MGSPMSSHVFSISPTSQLRVRAGPLGSALDGFADRLATEGYARFTIGLKLATTRDLGGWLEREGLAAESLDEQRVEAFLLTRDPRRRARRGEAATGRQLLDHLRTNGSIPPATPAPGPVSPIDRITDGYQRFLVNERGLSQPTVRNYLPIARAFLAQRFASQPVALESLTARDANQFVLREAGRLSRARSQLVVTALRSFLRHLHQRGDIPADLAGGLLPVRQWRLSGLPKALAPEQVQALLDSCDRSTAMGRRDRAILLLLARLGLRAGEVAQLTLDDFDWNEGTLCLTGKGQRREVLPLLHEVGEAVTEYLRDGRPQCPTRHLFVRVRAPYRPFRSQHAVGDLVRRAQERAGLDLPFKGAHLLRHSLATGMLRDGATLDDIGQILRHRHPDTTWIYAKVDLESLRTVAPVWPGGVA